MWKCGKRPRAAGCDLALLIAWSCQRSVVAQPVAVGRVLLDGRNRDFDQHLRRCQPGLDAGAGRQVLSARPSDPLLIHGIAVTDVRDPNHRRHGLGLIAAAQCQESIDFGQDLLGLPFDVLADVIGNDARREDKAIRFDNFIENRR